VIKSMRNVLSLDPTRSELILQLGEIYESKGDDAAALKEYERYAAKYPRDPRAQRRIGNQKRRTGAHAAAKAAYEKALLIEPQDVATLVEFGHLERYTGNFAGAEARYEQALAAAASPQTRELAMRGRGSLYEFRGQIRQSIEQKESSLEETAKYAPPAKLLLDRLELPGQWARIDADMAEKKLDELRKSLTPPWSYNLPIAEMFAYMELGDVARAEQAVNGLEQLMNRSNMQALRSMMVYGRGRVAELRGDCTNAVANYRESAALDPSDNSIHTHIGRCLRKLKQFREAQSELNQMLTAVPAHGPANLEMGLLMKDTGEPAKARAYLQRALKTWQNADANFKPALQARAALTALAS
jgi:tetratricopeptide (TPR) repeat protein